MSSIINIGCDIIEISRIRNSISRYGQRFLDRVFTSYEQAYCFEFKDPVPRFAARFAAKEAVAKALRTGLRPHLTWLDIEIKNESSGAPVVILSTKSSTALSHPKILISMSHCREYAMATALLI